MKKILSLLILFSTILVCLVACAVHDAESGSTGEDPIGTKTPAEETTASVSESDTKPSTEPNTESNVEAESDTNADTSPETEGETKPEMYIDINAWHLSTRPVQSVEKKEVPKEYKNYAVKLPLSYSETVDGFEVNFEFFQEYYLIGSMIQARISVKNISDKDVKFILNSRALGQFLKDNSDTLNHVILKYEPASYIISATQNKWIKKGETYVFQRAFYADPEYFTSGKEYVFGFGMRWCFEDEAYSSMVVTVPVDIVDLSKSYDVSVPPAETEPEPNPFTYVDPKVWYLSDELKEAVSLPVMLKEYEGYALKLPKNYTYEFDELLVNLDFFQEYYTYGSLIQLKIDITNKSEESITYRSNLKLGKFYRTSDPSREYPYATLKNDENNYLTSKPTKVELKPGKTVAVEGALVMEEFFFYSEIDDIRFGFLFRTYDEQGEIFEYVFDFPVEVVKIEG